MISLVTPQNWWIQQSSRGLRKWLLSDSELRLLATLGEEAWQSFGDRGPVACLLLATRQTPDKSGAISCIDALPKKTIDEKIGTLRGDRCSLIGQQAIEANPDSRLAFTKIDPSNLLEKHCESWHALVTSDNPRFMLLFSEAWGNGWEPYISSPTGTRLYGGREHVIAWMGGNGALHHDSKATSFPPSHLRRQKGVLLSQVRSLACTIFSGEIFAHGSAPLILFVRWKPLAEQPIGWESDINDGVRTNIRPFMTAKPLRARGKGACILRLTPRIKWDKDRGKEPLRAREDFPWLWGWGPDNKDDQKDFGGRGKEPDGNRWNDLHYTRAFKQAARDRSKSQ